jgi:GT2 family glycosyltransferase
MGLDTVTSTLDPSRGSKKTADDRLVDVAVIAIGRNEGERLRRCLQSVIGTASTVIYVDSGSTDGSVEMARSAGTRVVELDLSVPFTAARARNAGFAALGDTLARIDFVQFVDSDCEIERGWLATAHDFLSITPGVAGVFGRRRERFPDASIYNRLCDEEWDVPPGEVRACGGDVMLRADAFRDVGGFRPGLIAGEEPELCVRLRQRGWKIVCLPHPMTIHDAAMTRFTQWWRRMLRGGHAFAEGVHLHGAPPERHWVAEARRAWVWGAVIPFAILASAIAFGPAGLALALIYPLQIGRLYLKRRGASKVPLQSSIFLVLAKIPEAIGQAKFHFNRIRGHKAELIEYK